MRNRRVAFIVSFVFMLTTIFSSAVFAASFTDMAGHWAEDVVEKWADEGIIQGYEGKFRPDDVITQADLTIIIDNVMRYQQEGENKFSDLGDKYYTSAVLKASEAGILLGTESTLTPEAGVTREEAVVILANAFNIMPVEGQIGRASCRERVYALV